MLSMMSVRYNFNLALLLSSDFHRSANLIEFNSIKKIQFAVYQINFILLFLQCLIFNSFFHFKNPTLWAFIYYINPAEKINLSPQCRCLVLDISVESSLPFFRQINCRHYYYFYQCNFLHTLLSFVPSHFIKRQCIKIPYELCPCHGNGN